jgi:HEAT repeat protein
VSFLFPSPTITFDAALRDLASGSPKARAMAAHALGDVTDDPVARRRAVDALVRALDDDRPEVRAEAASSLGELGEPGALPHLIKRLGDGSPPVRQNAAIALGSLGLADAFEPLATALREGAPDLRFQAATSLAEIDAVRAFDPLVAALADSDAQVVGAAALSVGAIAIADDHPELRPRAVDALLGQLAHADGGTRFDVAYALAELRSPAGRAHLAAALEDDDRAWDAVSALGWIAGDDPPAREALTKAVTHRKVPAEAAVLAAGSLLGLHTSHEAARKLLLDSLTSRKEHVRAVAIEQLAATGGAWAKPALEKLARTGKGSDHLESIAGALRAISSRDALPESSAAEGGAATTDRRGAP